MKRILSRLITRWLVCSLGLWVAAGLLSSGINYDSRIGVILIGGLVLAIINILIRPVVIFLSIPALLLSLGLFMIIINGFMVFLASKLYTPLHITNFWAAMFAGIIIGLVNYLVTAILDERGKT